MSDHYFLFAPTTNHPTTQPKKIQWLWLYSSYLAKKYDQECK